ncbi:MAG: hypothetical protein ACRDJT_01335 [Actinomycetota bacterium]
MRYFKRNRVVLLAAGIGIAAGMVSWVGAPSEEAAGVSARPVPGQEVESGIIRHVVERPGVGTAFVADHAGPDDLSVEIDGVTRTVPTEGEVTNPAISESGTVAWAEDQARIKVWDPRTDEVTTLNRPDSTTAIFSPAFVTNDTIASVGQQPVPGVPGEDDGLNNLFEVNLDEGAWEPLTSFSGTLTDWTAVRTPVVSPDGDVLFIRVRGDSQATAQPGFELWTTSGEATRRLTKLPGEMYLAGFSGNTLMWNAPSKACEDWGLYEATPDGLEQIGCGAVLADPLGTVDPDLEHEEHVDFAAPSAQAEGDLGVIVGDFASQDLAAEAESRMRDVPGQRVVSHDSLPHAVAPGAWVVFRPVPQGMSPDHVLDDVRHEVPAYAEMTFVVPMGG